MAHWANEYVEKVARARSWRLDREYRFVSTEEEGDGYLDTYMVENLYQCWQHMADRVNDFIEDNNLDDIGDCAKIVHEFRYLTYKDSNGVENNFVEDYGGQAIYPNFTDFLLTKI